MLLEKRRKTKQEFDNKEKTEDNNVIKRQRKGQGKEIKLRKQGKKDEKSKK